MHRNTTYAIYWLPGGYSFGADSAGYETTIDRYFADVAADSGTFKNVYSIATEYYDDSGHIKYSQTFGGSTVDTTAFPPSGCTPNPAFGETVCLTGDQVYTELSKVVAAQGWPRTMTAAYFLFLPKGVGYCGVKDALCAFVDVCGLHDSSSPSPGKYLIYSPQLYLTGSFCAYGERPNGDADSTLNVVSHEHIEMITDPLVLPAGTPAWIDDKGYEIADKCAYTLGPMSGPPGGQYNQTINGHHYLLQEEYSNKLDACLQSAPPPPPVRCVVPKVRGKKLSAARRAIRHAHCSLGAVRKVKSRVKPGRVVSQKPRAGSHLRAGARVRLWVSR